MAELLVLSDDAPGEGAQEDIGIERESVLIVLVGGGCLRNADSPEDRLRSPENANEGESERERASSRIP